ncbi:hypothetical protein Amet_4547 [Alkaliphilus metalliredigens QYMF]|uniref:Uncharacterized protein n=1 Tax=Alkaliphilus metalliredigens (strain QYMF) TaxID=293826 RepID=A6TWQ1_ALKMQ|nr:hypothetical protein [Alkaliphilus metalliredigens]ABR50619.1 hypothetical protein Amet_4547 [Alkaliphilus metalliredigens QYMF]
MENILLPIIIVTVIYLPVIYKLNRRVSQLEEKVDELTRENDRF